MESNFSIFGVLWSCGSSSLGGLDLNGLMADVPLKPFKIQKQIARQLDVILRTGEFAYYTRFTIFSYRTIFSDKNSFGVFAYSSQIFLYLRISVWQHMVVFDGFLKKR